MTLSLLIPNTKKIIVQAKIKYFLTGPGLLYVIGAAYHKAINRPPIPDRIKNRRANSLTGFYGLSSWK
jgi:hypothetical protein